MICSLSINSDINGRTKAILAASKKPAKNNIIVIIIISLLSVFSKRWFISDNSFIYCILSSFHTFLKELIIKFTSAILRSYKQISNLINDFSCKYSALGQVPLEYETFPL